MRPQPDANVVSWLEDVDDDRVYLSVVSFAEIRHGIERPPDGRRRQRLEAWLSDELSARFEGRLLDVDRYVAERWRDAS